MDVSSEIQETLGRSYSVPDDIDEEDLMGGKLKIIQKFSAFFFGQNRSFDLPFNQDV